MYAQMVETGVAKLRDAVDMPPEEQAFQARINGGVESGDEAVACGG